MYLYLRLNLKSSLSLYNLSPKAPLKLESLAFSHFWVIFVKLQQLSVNRRHVHVCVCVFLSYKISRFRCFCPTSPWSGRSLSPAHSGCSIRYWQACQMRTDGQRICRWNHGVLVARGWFSKPQSLHFGRSSCRWSLRSLYWYLQPTENKTANVLI